LRHFEGLFPGWCHFAAQIVVVGGCSHRYCCCHVVAAGGRIGRRLSVPRAGIGRPGAPGAGAMPERGLGGCLCRVSHAFALLVEKQLKSRVLVGQPNGCLSLFLWIVEVSCQFTRINAQLADMSRMFFRKCPIPFLPIARSASKVRMSNKLRRPAFSLRAPGGT